MSLSRAIAVPPIPSLWPGVAVILRPVAPGFLLRLTD